jgi:hypothetical protein
MISFAEPRVGAVMLSYVTAGSSVAKLLLQLARSEGFRTNLWKATNSSADYEMVSWTSRS